MNFSHKKKFFSSIEECLNIIQETQVIIHHHFANWLAAGAYASIDIRRPTSLLGYCVFSLVYWRIISIRSYSKVPLKSGAARRVYPATVENNLSGAAAFGEVLSFHLLHWK